MNPSSLRVRRVTAEDVRALLGSDIHPEFCIGEPAGFAAERDGELVAIGTVTWDRWGRAWGWLNRPGAIPAVTMHRRARAMLSLLREVEEPALYVICNHAIPGADTWLRRLGFVEDETLKHPLGAVYRCDLST